MLGWGAGDGRFPGFSFVDQQTSPCFFCHSTSSVVIRHGGMKKRNAGDDFFYLSSFGIDHRGSPCADARRRTPARVAFKERCLSRRWHAPRSRHRAPLSSSDHRRSWAHASRPARQRQSQATEKSRGAGLYQPLARPPCCLVLPQLSDCPGYSLKVAAAVLCIPTRGPAPGVGCWMDRTRDTGRVRARPLQAAEGSGPRRPLAR